MKTILLDENLPVVLRHHLTDFKVLTVQFQGWTGKQNGELMRLIDGNFDVFLTGDSEIDFLFTRGFKPSAPVVVLPEAVAADHRPLLGVIASE